MLKKEVKHKKILCYCSICINSIQKKYGSELFMFNDGTFLTVEEGYIYYGIK